MDSFPPPQTPPSGPTVEPSTQPGRSKLMVGGIAALAAVVAAGGLVVGSQFASADRASIATTSAAAVDDDPPAVDDDPPAGDDDTPAGDDESGDDGVDLADVLPADVKAEFEAFEQCLDEQLGGVFGDLDKLEVWNGSVVVENLGGDGDEALSMYDFGAGDATVVVTKSGDTIAVETTGDVTTLDTTFFEAEKVEWEAAEAACAHLLPDGLPVFDMEFGELGGLLEDLPEMFDEGMFEEMFDDDTFAEFEKMFDEDMFAEIKDMFESGEFGKLFGDEVDVPVGGDSTD
jgi:hypothetical protein